MLDLMAEAARRQRLVLHLKKRTVAVLGTHTHHIGARHHAVLAGHAQAALQTGLLTFGGNNFGIDQFDDLVILIHHHAQTAQNTHLRRRQTHTAGINQRFGHIVKQCMQARVEICHRTADLFQAIITLQDNFS